MRPGAEVVDVTFCDQVRVEGNGKLLILGVYLGTVGVPSLPCAIPTFTFLIKWRLRSAPVPAGRYSLIDPQGQEFMSAEVGEIPFPKRPPKSGTCHTLGIHQLSPFVFHLAGTHRLTFTCTGRRRRTIATFDVVLAAADTEGDRSTEATPQAKTT